MSSSVLFWVPSEKEAWEAAEVLKDEGSSIQFRTKAGSTVTMPGPLSEYMTLEAESLNEDCENLVSLETYHEGIILHHIKVSLTDSFLSLPLSMYIISLLF